jgi:hypothetical protein
MEMANVFPKIKFEFFALAQTGSIRPELMAEGSSDPTLRAGPQFPRCLQRGMNSNSYEVKKTLESDLYSPENPAFHPFHVA